MRATLDLTEEPLHHIVGANRLPVLLWKRVEGQTGLQIALQARNGAGIHLLIFLDEGRYSLISPRDAQRDEKQVSRKTTEEISSS